MTVAALKALPLVVALAGAVGGDVLAGRDAGSLRPHWAEVRWPFPIDQWGTGRAFACSDEACGAAITVYLRPKVGFCNCSRGVYDDTELDRVGDLELLGSDFAGVAPGRPVTVGWMQGRARVFTVSGRYQPSVGAAAIAFNDKCDVVVATVTAQGDVGGAERRAIEFLNSDFVLRWARAELGAGGS